MPRKDFKFFHIFKELFVFAIAKNPAGAKYCTPGSQDSPVINTLRRLESLVYLSPESF
jgi:hypothetical protein